MTEVSESPTLVVGGGIVGMSAALFLARRGEPVVVLDRAPPGGSASAHNAGILAMGHPPLPRPGLAGQLVRLVFSPTNPLYVAPRLDPELPGWLLQFLRACRRERYERSVALLARLGWEAGAVFRELAEREGIACEYRPAGWLEVFRTPAALAAARPHAETLRGHGYTIEELSGNELRARDPAFTDAVAGALHHRDSASAHPGAFMEGLREAARRQGVEIRDGRGVARVALEGGRAGGVVMTDGEHLAGRRVLLAAGVWTSGLARTAGVRVPMQAGKGYRVELSGVETVPSAACVLAETFVAVTPFANGLRLAGTVELSGLGLETREKRLRMLRRGARDYVRGIDGAREHSSWCGHRPLTADGLPVVGPAPGVPGLHVATGHAMMGFLLGPLTGRLACELMLDGRASLDVAELSPARLARA